MSTQQPNLKLQALSALLRNQAEWPASFGPWNYGNWETCAIGLAYQAGIITDMGQEFDLAPRDFDAIFAAPPYHLSSMPEQVANRIDNHLTRQRERRREAISENRHGWHMAFAVAS